MKYRNYIGLIGLCLALVGCCALECVAPLQPIKAYLQYWEKYGMTDEARRRDSAECGGGASEENAPSFGEEQVRSARRIGDKDEFASRTRLFHDWERCLLKKGYQFTGKCYDNETSRAKPACGAP
jgi:hypothetical protein